MTDSEIIDRLGGTSCVAAIFGIRPPSVSDWRLNGIPTARRQTLALMYPDIVPKDWGPSRQGSIESSADSLAAA